MRPSGQQGTEQHKALSAVGAGGLSSGSRYDEALEVGVPQGLRLSVVAHRASHAIAGIKDIVALDPGDCLSTWPMPLSARRAASAMELTWLNLRITRYMTASALTGSYNLRRG
jgi:hypothetical protein